MISLVLRNLPTTLSRNLVTEMSLSSRNMVSVLSAGYDSMNLVTVTSLEC